MKRREILTGMCALGLAQAKHAHTAEPGASDPPAIGDVLVYAFGDRAGEAIRPEDLSVGAEQIMAYPKDPASGVVRNGTRLNQLIVTSVAVDLMSEQTAQRSANGVVAYSGVCSHTGCDVTDWDEAQARFQCPCHESQFDPADAARVVGGPAPWPLAALPLQAADDGTIVVAGEFEGRLGFQQPGLSPFG